MVPHKRNPYDEAEDMVLDPTFETVLGNYVQGEMVLPSRLYVGSRLIFIRREGEGAIIAFQSDEPLARHFAQALEQWYQGCDVRGPVKSRRWLRGFWNITIVLKPERRALRWS